MGVCSPWATVEEVQGDPACGPCGDPAVVSAELLEEGLLAASDILNNLANAAGYSFPGLCTDTVRPCAGYSSGGFAWHGRPVVGLGAPLDSWGLCGCSGTDCSCIGREQVTLGRYPVRSIEAVTIDGEAITEGFHVRDHRWLVRDDGQAWPCCQDLTELPGADGTWTVDFTYGTAPPPAGKRAALVLGCQLAISWCPSVSDQCRLPRKVQSVNRQQVSIVVLDPTQFMADGRWGLPEVDGWLASLKLKRKARPARIASLDRPREVSRVTWVPGS